MLISKGAGAINMLIVPEPVFPYYLRFLWLSAASVRYRGFYRRLSAVADL